MKRIKRSRQAKAEQGSFVGGRPGLGYKLVYQNGKRGDLAIDENEAETIKVIFNILEATGGNIGATAKRVNELGYAGKTGRPFIPNSLKRIINRKLYIGILETSLSDKVSHRPDLQIISIDQFERVREFVKNRKVESKNMGQEGAIFLPVLSFVAAVEAQRLPLVYRGERLSINVLPAENTGSKLVSPVRLMQSI